MTSLLTTFQLMPWKGLIAMDKKGIFCKEMKCHNESCPHHYKNQPYNEPCQVRNLKTKDCGYFYDRLTHDILYGRDVIDI